MADESERLTMPISTAELERRWKAVRKAMKEQRVDVLVMQNNNDFMGGYVKYFTDLPATNGYALTVLFPRDEGMTMIGQGPFGGDRMLPPEGDGVRRGVKRVMTSPSYSAAPYTKENDAALAEKALEAYSGATIGLVGTGALPVAFVDYLRRYPSGARAPDATGTSSMWGATSGHWRSSATAAASSSDSPSYPG